MPGSRGRLIFIYDYFYPGYKAGGPVQSLINLAAALSGHYEICIITSARDINERQVYAGIRPDEWNDVHLPGQTGTTRIFYAATPPTAFWYAAQLDTLQPAAVYLNNIYSGSFFRQVLRKLKGRGQVKLIVCPRGMLQKGALAVKPLRKRLYLFYLRQMPLLPQVWWHATNDEEAADIRAHFPAHRGVTIAPNIPRRPINAIDYPRKQPGKLRLVYLSLISRKKNLLQLLEFIKDKNVSLDIYGPVSDPGYWQSCLVAIAGNEKVAYRGMVEPAAVQEVLAQYDAFAMLTAGENFGHALYESFSVGRPVITSCFTPWTDLHQKKAGFNVDLSAPEKSFDLLDRLVEMDVQQFMPYCDGAHSVASAYYNSLNLNSYLQLFA